MEVEIQIFDKQNYMKAEIDEEKIEAFRGTISLPFSKPESKQIAVKIIDDRGIESLKIVRL